MSASVKQDVAAEIDRRLAATVVPGSRNVITASDLRTWAVEHLREYEEELARFPQLAGKPHWNLWMMDAESEDALFAVLVFRPDTLQFFCGTGNSYAIQSWSGDFPADPTALVDEASREFRVPEEGLIIDRVAAGAWLGRGW